MLLIWCDWKGIVLPRNETINSSLYCRQLESNNVIHEKRSELMSRGRVGSHLLITPDSIHHVRDSLKIVAKMKCVTIFTKPRDIELSLVSFTSEFFGFRHQMVPGSVLRCERPGLFFIVKEL